MSDHDEVEFDLYYSISHFPSMDSIDPRRRYSLRNQMESSSNNGKIDDVHQVDQTNTNNVFSLSKKKSPLNSFRNEKKNIRAFYRQQRRNFW